LLSYIIIYYFCISYTLPFFFSFIKYPTILFIFYSKSLILLNYAGFQVSQHT
jgi:hypothetical protein